MNLTSRYILVKKTSSGEYELAHITRWEYSGFYPFAYEYGLKDLYLGDPDVPFSWYILFKSRMEHLLPQLECHTKLIKALWILGESVHRDHGYKYPAEVEATKRWIEMGKMERSLDYPKGWVLKPSTEAPADLSKDDWEKLAKELGFVVQSDGEWKAPRPASKLATSDHSGERYTRLIQWCPRLTKLRAPNRN